MKTQRFAIALTLIDLALLILLLAKNLSAEAQNVAPVLRGRALEIVDSKGRVRASITVEPPVTMDSRAYPETVLLRLSHPKSGPVVKITATEEGSAIGLSDDVDGGVEVSSTKHKGNFIKVVSREGREQIIKP
ncbi:hypothetical protein L0337_25630 [candidate division KSB1 bacterium]|nr:hypothetical protein [candidate division KSB1 bacterium]